MTLTYDINDNVKYGQVVEELNKMTNLFRVNYKNNQLTYV